MISPGRSCRFPERTLLTGGTGLMGRYVLESILVAAEQLSINPMIVVVSRDPKTFLKKCPWLDQRPIKFIQAHITSVEFSQFVDFIIHAATETAAIRYQRCRGQCSNKRLKGPIVFLGSRRNRRTLNLDRLKPIVCASGYLSVQTALRTSLLDRQHQIQLTK